MLSLWKLEGVIVFGVVVSEDDEFGGGERESLRRLAEGSLGAAIVRVDMEEKCDSVGASWSSSGHQTIGLRIAISLSSYPQS